MNIYFILFIVVIPFAIFFITIFSDREFKRRLIQLKNEINKPFNALIKKKEPKQTNEVYRINNGIGFGFGKEFFACGPQQKKLSHKESCQVRNASIGIRFHKFKMNKSFNIPEIDEVVLKDYCSKSYLEKNFVNLINSAWTKSGLKFYIREMIDEDEHDNLSKYYNYSPYDNTIYPKCEDIVNFNQNPIELKGRIPPYVPTTQSISPTSSSVLGAVSADAAVSAAPVQASSTGRSQNRQRAQGTQSFTESEERESTAPLTSVDEPIGTFGRYEPDEDEDEGTTTEAVEGFVGNQFFNSIFRHKPIPDLQPRLNPEVITPIPENIKRVGDKDIKKMVALDIYILQRLLGKENILNEKEKKNIIRNIFYRMTDETQYIDDRDLHIYLVPYIADDISFIVEGRNNRPLIVISMFQKDCNKMERVIENVTTDKTCGSWLDLLLSNYLQLRNFEKEYNEIANVDFKLNELNPCGPKEIDVSPHVNDEIKRLRKAEEKIMNQIEEIKDANPNLNRNKIQIDKNLNKLDKLYNYDYNNDHEVKILKNFKNKRKSVLVKVNGEARYELYDYNQLRNQKIDEIKSRNENEINLIKQENKNLQHSLEIVDNKISDLKFELDKIREKINDRMVPKKSKVKTLEAIKKRIETKTKEISAPMYYAEKTRNVLNINLMLTILFGQINNELLAGKKLKEINKDFPICNILTKNLVEGGITISNKERLLNKRADFSFLNLSLDDSLRNVIIGPENNKNGLFKKSEANKCSILGYETIRLENATISNPISFCDNSQYYETSILNALDINAQYYFVNKILGKINDKTLNLNIKEIAKLEEFKKKIEFECTGCNPPNNKNYRAEPDFIKSEEIPAFFSNDEAIKNYEWLAEYIVKNRINIKNADFIYEEANYLYNNSDVFTEELRDSFFPKEPEVTDAIHCPILDKPNNLFNIDTTPLNDYILKKGNCNTSYLDSFKDSYI